MSRIVEHGVKELVRVGLFDHDADYDGQAAIDTMALLMLFASQGHSGQSAALVIDLFSKLAKRETL